MPDPIWRTEITKYNLLCMKLEIWKFLASLISNQELNFENAIWSIQYDGLKSQNNRKINTISRSLVSKTSHHYTKSSVVRFFYARWSFFPELGSLLGKYLIQLLVLYFFFFVTSNNFNVQFPTIL